MNVTFDVDVRTGSEKSAEAHELMEGLIEDGITVDKLYTVVRSSLTEEQAGQNRPRTVTELEFYLDALDVIQSPLLSAS